MKLLDINLPSATRIQYANSTCKNIWAEKIDKSTKLYNSLEILTVKNGVRKCAIGHGYDPHNFDKIALNFAEAGLYALPIYKESRMGGGFSHNSGIHEGEDSNYTFRVAISASLQDARDLVEAHYMNDDVRVGELLGFPTCCSNFFDKVWGEGYVDPIWQQVENTDKHLYKNYRDNDNESFVRFKGDIPKEILSSLRYVGTRFISHFACSLDCKESVKIAQDWMQVGIDEGLVEEVQAAKDILNLPFEWNCYKGIAVINTPVFKVVTTSVTCDKPHIIQVESDYYPKEAPNGLQFPWNINIPKVK